MNNAGNRLAIAEVTATLTTDFDLPTVLHLVAEHARAGFEAYSAAVVLLDHRRTAGDSEIQVVAQALREGVDVDVDLSFNGSGPGLVSAREGALTMISDLGDKQDTRWPEYRRYAIAAGMRGMRAFPVTSLEIPLGSLVVHTDEPWGLLRPNDFGQILANLIAIALAGRSVNVRRDELADTIEAVLRGTVSIATATGILAECLGLDARQARLTLIRLARARDVTVTAYADSVIDAQRSDPDNFGSSGIFDPPSDLAPPRHIDT